MDMRKRRKHSNKKLPIGTIVIRKQKRSDGSRFKYRAIKVRHAKGGLAFQRYARWLWEKHYGPVPQGKRVIHKDGDEMNDDLENLTIVDPGDVAFLFCHSDPEKSAENYRRVAAATAEFNREMGRIRRATSILPTHWYAVDLDKRAILNRPQRELHRLFPEGTGGSQKNGSGWQGGMLGWSGMRCLEASILAAIADGRLWNLRDVSAGVEKLRARVRFKRVNAESIRTGFVWLVKAGYVARPMRGRYRATEKAMTSRGPVWPYVAVRGDALLAEEQFNGFALVDPETLLPAHELPAPSKEKPMSMRRRRMEDVESELLHA